MALKRRNGDSNYYKQLQDDTLAMLQLLSGNIWTDFNIHDPGITIADLCNYALYELGYIFESPFGSFLAVNRNGEPHYVKQGLLPAQEIFAPTVVTTADYENLIKENISEVINCEVCLSEAMLYNILIQVKNDTNKEQIVSAVENLYHKHRNLCENLGNITIGKIQKPENRYEQSENYPIYDNTPENVGTIRHLPANYYSFQNHFPENYGISERGISGNAPIEYKAQVRQLKAYLLIFDYLLADTIQQAGNITTLLELSEKIPNTPLPSVKIRDIEKLIDTDKLNKTEIHDNQFLHIQKSRFLDLLDTIYGEDTKVIFRKEKDIETQNRKRAELIRRFPNLNKNRFCSYNILDSTDHLSGIKNIMGAVLGYKIEKEISVSTVFAHYRLQLLGDSDFFTKHKSRLNINFTSLSIMDESNAIPLIDIEYTDKNYEALYRQINMLWHNLLFESFLIYGSNLENYKIINKYDRGYLLIFKFPKKDEYLNIGLFMEKETLIKAANLFCKFIAHLSIESQAFYLVEHILLSTEPDDIAKDYNTLTIIVPHWIKGTHNKEKYEEILKGRLPAHLNIHFLWLNAKCLHKFETLYYAWRKTMAEKDKKATTLLSASLKLFIAERQTDKG